MIEINIRLSFERTSCHSDNGNERQSWNSTAEERAKKKRNAIAQSFSRVLFLYLLCVILCLPMWNWNKIQLHCGAFASTYVCGAKRFICLDIVFFPLTLFLSRLPFYRLLTWLLSRLEVRMCLVLAHRIQPIISWVSIHRQRKRAKKTF